MIKNTRKNSVKIGNFEQDKKGIMHGRIFGLGIGVTPVMFEPQTSKEGKQYFRLIADPANEAYEIGAAFPKDKDGMIYHSVSIESPVLPAPINAALFQDKETGAFNLVWSRQEIEHAPKAEATVNVNYPQKGRHRPKPQLRQRHGAAPVRSRGRSKGSHLYISVTVQDISAGLTPCGDTIFHETIDVNGR
jgi:uncharacterized protein (DUF736 family)